VKTVLIVCNPQEKSFSHAIASAVMDGCYSRGAEVRYHDLYEERFDPVLPATEILSKFSFDPLVQRHMDDVEWADMIVIVHPDWWGQPPAMLKGWIDRVLRPGIAYEYRGEEGGVAERVPLLSDKRAAVFCSTDAKREDDPGTLKSIWSRSVWNFCGIENAEFHLLFNTRGAGWVEREAWLKSCRLIAEGWGSEN